MNVSASTVIQYLRLRVGEGALRLSDIYFAYPQEKRAVLQEGFALATTNFLEATFLHDRGLTSDDLHLFEFLGRPRVFDGDLYEYVSQLERAFHDLVRETLETEFGEEEAGWWRQGVQKEIRAKCVTRREHDDEPCEPFAYTDLIDLSEVISNNWKLFQARVPKVFSDRRSLGSALRRLNAIRNAVMHPVKRRKWTEDDFHFVRSLRDRFESGDAT